MKKEERELLLRERLKEMKTYERAFYGKDVFYVAGMDEAGRGPLAGPVVAAAVILPPDFDLLGVDDSKKLIEKKREALFELIKEQAVAYGMGMADHRAIDEINILEATKLAMKRAVEALEVRLAEKRPGGAVQHLLIDALTLKDVPIPQTGIVKGDSKSVSIAAASILAKVTRDRMMAEYDIRYPGYGFASNKGYGTKAHYAGIETQGICPIHRKTFLKSVLQGKLYEK